MKIRSSIGMISCSLAWLWFASLLWWWPRMPSFATVILTFMWLGGGLWWWRQRYHRWSTDVAGAAMIITVLIYGTLDPHMDREWVPEHAKLATATCNNDHITISNVRWQRDFKKHSTITWEQRHYTLDECQSVDLFVVPFGAWRGPAHVMVSFGFVDETFLTISIEARREVGEVYAIAPGIRRHFELIYIIGDERDVIARRLLCDGDDVHGHRLRATPTQAQQLLVSMLTRTNALAVHPEFYHTTLNSCASNLRDHGDEILNGSIGHDWRVWLPGYAASLAHDHQLIDTTIKPLLISSDHDYGPRDEQWSQRIRMR